LKAKWFNLLRRKKSIRGEIFWAFLNSFIMAVLTFMITAICATLFVNHFQKGYYLHNFSSIAFVGSFIFSFYKRTHPIVNDLITLANGLQTISEGQLNYRVPVTRKDELGRVALSINTMAERLQLLIEKERKLESSKMELITGVSHDLRTPLTSIIGYLNLLRTESFQDKEEYTRFVQNAYNKSLHLKKQIDDLFEYTRLIAPGVQFKYTTVDVQQLLSQMLFEFETLAQENHIQVIQDLRTSPVLASIDSEKLARAIDNLLMNALKYSVKPGAIYVSLETRDHYLFIAFKNKGRTLTHEQEQRLFDRFYKVDHSRSSEGIQHGTGLGLSIAKNIIELHGGSLTLVHREGEFIFTMAIPQSIRKKESEQT
jgi:signal transduction histidine kinase